MRAFEYGSKQRSAHELHPGTYESKGLLDLVKLEHTRADVNLVGRLYREALARPWLTLLIDIWTPHNSGILCEFRGPLDLPLQSGSG